jgi:hypothetical protein
MAAERFAELLSSVTVTKNRSEKGIIFAHPENIEKIIELRRN